MLRWYAILAVLMGCLELRPLMAVEQAGVLNIQTQLTAGQQAAFGRVTPVDIESLGNGMINPASLAGLSYNQVLIGTNQVAKQFDYRHLSIAMPLGTATLGVSYGSNVTAGFIKTTKQNNVVYNTGTFSSGFDVLHLALAKKRTERLWFVDHIYYGMGLSVLSQVMDSSRRSPAYGIDVGVIGTRYIQNHSINRVDVGASVIGAYSTKLPKWTYDDTVGTSAEQAMARQLYAGTTVTAFNYKTQFKAGIYSQDVDLRDVMLGVEYALVDALRLRGATTYDPTQGRDWVYHFGLGLMLKRVAGIGNHVYNMALDYSYTMYPFPRTEDPSHTISVSFLGESADQRPVVLSPSVAHATQSPYVDFRGQAQRNAQVYVYSDDALVGQVRANNDGQWAVSQLAMSSGYNTITFRSKSDQSDLSAPSTPVVVHYDREPPQIQTRLTILNHRLGIDITSNEALSRAEWVSGNQTLAFRALDDRRYGVVMPLPEGFEDGAMLPSQMKTYDIRVVDSVGNVAPTASVSFFIQPIFPSDQTVVYNDAITVLGYASPDVQAIHINGNKIQPDANNAFSVPIELNYGKQLMTVQVTTHNGATLTYYARLLCIRRFSDIPTMAKYRRDVENVATLGYVTAKDDGLFHPDATMTRREIVRAIAKQQKLTPTNVTRDPFMDIRKEDPDAGLLAAAVNAGIVTAFPNGTFQPDRTVSVVEAFNMLQNANIIDSDDVVVSQAAIKRYEFALMFKQVPRYEQRVLYLMDWDQGYAIPN
ncbi:MAG: S-layer homology domain-containing protein [Candidatus Marinamargulisbacteria bacterium]